MDSPDLLKPKPSYEDLYKTSPRLVASLVTHSDDEEFPLLFDTKQWLEVFGTRMEQQRDLRVLMLRYNSSSLLRFKTLASIAKSRVRKDLEVLLKSWNYEFNVLLKHFATKEDQEWVSGLKRFTTFSFRHHFSRLFFPTGLDDTKFQITVNRSHVLEDSFHAMINTHPRLLDGGLSPQFVYEAAIGPGALREWAYLVADRIFAKERNLFLTSPDDSRRYFPTQQSDAKGLDLFRFTGRFVALVLRHEIVIGIRLDPIFFLHLAKIPIQFEDLKKRDKAMYNSMKSILDIAPSEVEGLGLTFDNEDDVAVTYENRESYINSEFQRLYVTSVENEVTHFSQGFQEMLLESSNTSSFFNVLELKDVDHMLGGYESDMIRVWQWKKVTEYDGFEETDDEIEWFWRAVNEMDNGARMSLLYFWTALKYLPRNGFDGLSQPLQLWKSYTSPDQLPKSSTCFYRLSLPPYKSFEATKEKLTYVSQSHICASFGEF